VLTEPLATRRSPVVIPGQVGLLATVSAVIIDRSTGWIERTGLSAGAGAGRAMLPRVRKRGAIAQGAVKFGIGIARIVKWIEALKQSTWPQRLDTLMLQAILMPWAIA